MDEDPEMISLIIEILNLTQGDIMSIKSEMNKWYDDLSYDKKIKILDRFNELMKEKGMILMGGESTIKPDHELPHGSENSIKKRKRERKEKKISDKCRARAVAEAYSDYLKEKISG